MKVGAAFPSKYLKHSDLEGRSVNVQIKSYDIEDIGDGEKPILFFRQGKKGLVLNRINGETIAELLGTDEMDDWIGQTICLFPDKTSFQGKRVDCIRVKAATKAAAAPAKQQRRQPEPPPLDTSDDDDREPVLNDADDSDIPF